MKKYTINHCYDINTTVEVLADSEEEAKQKASVINLKIEDAYNIYLNEQEIIEVEDVGDLNEMIEKAGRIIREYKGDDPFPLNKYPKISLDYWNGETYETESYLLEDVFWDYEKNEITVSSDKMEDVAIKELPEFQQYEIYSAILESKVLM